MPITLCILEFTHTLYQILESSISYFSNQSSFKPNFESSFFKLYLSQYILVKLITSLVTECHSFRLINLTKYFEIVRLTIEGFSVVVLLIFLLLKM